MASGAETSRSITEKYLARIAALDRQGPALRQVLETNPDALAIAAELDAERKAGRVRGPLHGVPILLKDNIGTARSDDDDGGIAGARRLDPGEGRVRRAEAARGRRDPPRQDEPERVGEFPLDALDERMERPRRPGRNPYALDRNTSGSSSGSGAAVAASYAAAAIGTRDRRLDRLAGATTAASSGSSRRSGWSAGRASSRSRTRRTRPGRWRAPSPMRRSCSPQSPASIRRMRRETGARRKTARDYTQALNPAACKGARIGVPRKGLFGCSPHADRLVEGGDRRC